MNKTKTPAVVFIINYILPPHYQDLSVSTLNLTTGARPHERLKKKKEKPAKSTKAETSESSELVIAISTNAGILQSPRPMRRLGFCVTSHLISAVTHNLHHYFDLTHTHKDTEPCISFKKRKGGGAGCK